MTVYDSSVLVEYLSGTERAVEYVESNADRRAVAPPIVLYEIYQGEVFKSGSANFDAVDDALSWVTVPDQTRAMARAAGELQNDLHEGGQSLAARDAFIAGTATAFGDTLAVADSDFDVEGIREQVDVDFIEPG
jgi:predicted nucleic acid-binding protein